MIEDKLISVILPVYNAEKYIAASIESILNQIYKNFELIIINDGSIDNTHQICDSFRKKDNRIIVFNKKNEGLTKALNFGIQKAKGIYIARQDADDVSKKNRLLKQKLFLENNKLIMCGTNCEIRKRETKKINWSIEFSHHKIVKKLEYSNCFIHSSVMFIKNEAQKVNFYDEKINYAQDYDLWWKLSLIGTVGNLKEKLVILNQHIDSISNTKENEQTLCFIKSAVKYYFYKFFVSNHRGCKFDENDELNKNQHCLNFKNLLLFYYSDKLNEKKKFRDLSFEEKKLIFKYPLLLFRKLIK